MAVEIEFGRKLNVKLKICEWYINGKIIRLNGFEKKDIDILKKLLDDIEFTLVNDRSFYDLVSEYYFNTILDILFYIFRDLTEKYLYRMSTNIEDKIITLNQLFNYVFNKNMPTQWNSKTKKFFTEVVFRTNKIQRFLELEKRSKVVLNKDWDVQFVERKVWTFKWKINGVYVNFIGTNYSDKEVVILTLKEIENCLINFYTFYELEKIHPTMTIAKICSDIMPELTKSYLQYYSRILTGKKIVISERALNKCIFTKYKSDRFSPSYNKIVSEVVGREYRTQYKYFTNTSMEFNFDKDVWQYYFCNKKSIHSYKLNFGKVNNKNIKYELKQYFSSLLKERTTYNEKLNEDFRVLVLGLNFMVNSNRNVKFSADVGMLDIKNMFKYLSNEYITQYNKNFSPKTLTIYTAKFRKYYEWLIINSAKVKTKNVQINHFNKIKWNNISNMSKNTKYIPECVVEKLLGYIEVLNKDFQTMLLVMLNGGLHYKDVALLTESCIEEENGQYILNYIPYKTHKSRINNGLSKHHRIIIHESVAYEIMEQIKRTKQLRETSGLKEIFIHNFDKTYIKVYDTKSFNRAINEVINKYNITDDDGQVWRFTSKQCRKTLAVDMIMNGAKANEVANYLGHNKISTTNKYYAEVRKMKLADMNDEFWGKEFKSIVPKEQLNQFTEEERKLLYAEFKLGMREVELGYCMKGFWEEPCSKLSGRVSCATCEKICLGVQKKRKWELLKESQKKIIEDLIYGYKKLGIKNYKEYREYQREEHLLKVYEEALYKIIKFSGDEIV